MISDLLRPQTIETIEMPPPIPERLRCWHCRENPRAVVYLPWGESFLGAHCSGCSHIGEVLERLSR